MRVPNQPPVEPPGATLAKPRMLVWFSCGAASAVAAKLALDTCRQDYNVVVVNCDTRSSEHPDNYRFSADVERWLGQPIVYLRRTRYSDVNDVIYRTGYMSGVRGARCTTELKKIPRMEFAEPDDTHVFGFVKGEERRVREFSVRNPDMKLRWLLLEYGVTKAACYAQLSEAGIELPAMYRLGFRNNNCPGCVKATSPWYWDKIRTHFPLVFECRCKQSRELGVRLVEIRHHVRIFLDELPSGPFRNRRENLSCGPECGLPTQAFSNASSKPTAID